MDPAPMENITLPAWAPDDPTASCVPTVRRADRTASTALPAAAPTEVAERAAEPYTLVGMVGRGGMGEVWEASQNALRRTVAIKRIRADRARAEGEERWRLEAEFRQEALTTARLEHPNIVPVYELGEGPDGAPLLLMKLVRGIPWHEKLRDDIIEYPEAEYYAIHIPILAAVAQAVAFAHSRGIVHRDLKPSQVMLGEFGEVLLMDWGLAIAWRDPLQANPLLALDLPTNFNASSPAGTFAYMAPEQTEDSAQNVGPWTDVFLLGATLYQILTGSPPHAGESARAVFYRAMAAKVDRPEARLPGREIPRELADLAMQAMAARREDRTPGAREFVLALQAYLAGAGKRRESAELAEAVRTRLAGAGDDYTVLTECATTLARARGLWPANPALAELALAATTSFTRAAFASGDLRLARTQAAQIPDAAESRRQLEAIEREDRRIRSRERQRRALLGSVAGLILLFGASSWRYARDMEAERDRTALQKTRADVARGDAEDLARFMVNDLYASLERAGRVRLLEGTGEKALAYFNKLAPAEMTRASQIALATIYQRLSSIMRDVGRAGDAIAAINKAIDAAGTPGSAQEHMMLSGLLSSKASFVVMEGDPKGAAALVRSSHGTLGDPPPPGGSLADFSTFTRAALALGSCATLALEHEIADGRLRQGLAALDAAEDKGLGEAEALELRAQLQAAQALLDLSRSKPEAGIASAELATQTYERLIALDPGNAKTMKLYSAVLSLLGTVWREGGMAQVAEQYFRRDVDVARQLLLSDPFNVSALRDLRVSISNLVLTLNALKRGAEAMPLAAEQVELAEKAIRLDPASVRYGFDLSTSLGLAAQAAELAGNTEEALKWYRRFLDHTASLNAPDVPAQQSDNLVAERLVNCGNMMSRLGDGDQAVRAWKLCLGLVERTADSPYFSSMHLEPYIAAAGNLAQRLPQRGERDEVRRITRNAVAFTRQALKSIPDETARRSLLAMVLTRNGTAAVALGDWEDATSRLDESLELNRALMAEAPTDPARRFNLYAAINGRALAAYNQRDWKTAETFLREAIALFEEGRSLFPQNFRRELGGAAIQSNLSIVLAEQGRLEEAAEVLASARARFAADVEELGAEAQTESSLNGQAGTRAWMEAVDAHLARRRGDAAAVRAHYARVLEIIDERPAHFSSPFNVGLRVQALAATGRVDEARALGKGLLDYGFRDFLFEVAAKEHGLRGGPQ